MLSYPSKYNIYNNSNFVSIDGVNLKVNNRHWSEYNLYNNSDFSIIMSLIIRVLDRLNYTLNCMDIVIYVHCFRAD